MTAELASTIKKLNSTDSVTEFVSEEEDIFSDESIQNQLNAIEKETEPEKKKV
jgi:3-methyladenine DNA glycosylase AlkC